ncbi:hypothetical protein K461DRAFT_276901 [Myriangium duriaei CBS 260.36]|uniref:Uncharacterized protein n=1 Tax=Myriangium duriaei CBS 260.36 TaxID=1168546 RepID=A0A9P4J616_9PEZI|nr:hypothetical protein K461DRAFT_276901 [Myriangium duriaei CBS 260.36]
MALNAPSHAPSGSQPVLWERDFCSSLDLGIPVLVKHTDRMCLVKTWQTPGEKRKKQIRRVVSRACGTFVDQKACVVASSGPRPCPTLNRTLHKALPKPSDSRGRSGRSSMQLVFGIVPGFLGPKVSVTASSAHRSRCSEYCKYKAKLNMA